MRKFCQIRLEHLASTLGSKKNFPFNHYIIVAMNDGDTNTVNQGKRPRKQEFTMLGMLAMGASEKGNPTNFVSLSCRELDDHSFIITLQRYEYLEAKKHPRDE